MRLPLPLLLAALAASAATHTAKAGPNLIVNGNFAAGLTGFTSDYAVPTNPACIYNQMVYCQGPEATIFVNTDPNLDHPAWTSFASSPGNGSPNMLIVNGGTDAAQAVWRQTGIAVMQNELYEFTGYAASSYSANPGVLALTFNGVTTGAAYAVNGTPGAWGEFTYDWYSGSATSLDLALFDLDIAANGNDFALDNFFLVEITIPEPASIAALSVGVAAVMANRKRRYHGSRVRVRDPSCTRVP